MICETSNHVHSPAPADGVSVWTVVHVAPSADRSRAMGAEAADHSTPTVVTGASVPNAVL